MNSFEILGKMSERNKNIKLASFKNIEEIRIRKSGWGYVKIAVDNETAQELLNHHENYLGGLLIADKSEFDEIKQETEVKTNE